MKKNFTAHLIFAATAMASQQVWALGFGRVVSDAVLGQTLTFTLPVHVEPGERLGVDCVSAEVYFGESRVQPNQVRTTVDRGTSDNDWLVKITTLAPVEEPVVEVALSAGCDRRFSRRFTVFADPPMLGSSRTAVAQAQPDATSSPPTALAPIAGNGGGSGSTSTVAVHADGAGRPLSRRERAAQRRAERAARADSPIGVLRKGPTLALANALAASTTAPAHVRRAQVPTERGPLRGTASRVVPSGAPAASARLVLDGGYAHLKLDIEDPILPAPLAASGAGAMAGSSDIDDPDTRQLRALEQSIQAMKREQQVNRDTAARLQSELADAQSHGDWLPYVLGLLALAMAAAVALAWKLRQQSKLAHSAWFTESQVHSKAPLPIVAAPPPLRAPSATIVAPPVVAVDSEPSIGGQLEDDPLDLESSLRLPVAVSGVDATSATSPLDRAALASVVAQESDQPRELSVEELLDLEQQADFFIALGQEDAAVDLLMSHLRSAGGQSPLPYTKLLEIYRRQGDRSAYERIRARFNRRFNAYAPDWDTGPSSGRSLEDYPDTVRHVQDTWHSPIDAMAVLEGLLFKRDDTSELFDLPAYRDVLVLYSLARDLWQQSGGNASTQVDVLLPLDDPNFSLLETTASGVSSVGTALAAPPTPTPSPASAVPTKRTSFESTDYHASNGDLDLDITSVDGNAFEDGYDSLDSVHATLDALSLAPVENSKPASAPLDWDLSDSKPGGSHSSP